MWLGIWGLGGVGVGFGELLGAGDVVGDFLDQIGDVLVIVAVVEGPVEKVVGEVAVHQAQLGILAAALVGQIADADAYVGLGMVFDSG